MSASETLYSARFLGPETIERARTQTLTCPVYWGGGLVAPSSGTVTIYDASGSAIVSAAAVTITSSVATYSLSSASIPATLTLGDGWLVEWALTISGIVHTFRTDAALCYRRLYPVVTDADLLRRHTDLSALKPSTETSYQDYLDEAWAQICARLVSQGRRPWLILSPSDLREAQMTRTLGLIFRDFASSMGEGKYSQMADYYDQAYEQAWRNLNFRYAEDEAATSTSSTRRRSAVSQVWLCGRG